MHRNTLLLVIFLAVVAALVVGVHIGRNINPSLPVPVPTPQPLLSPSPSQVEPVALSYTNEYCGFSLSYPNTLTLNEGASGSAALTDSSGTNSPILMACQEDIPRPPLIPERIEVATIAGVQNAKIYHDASPKDGTPMDALIFTNPNNGLDVFISGLGTTFNQIISTVQILP